jgi:8-oxo-dGTP pyrophosphatase MutT (NUDIX family)
MVRRSRGAEFMAGAHVFPGGGVDDVDGGPQARAAVSWTGDPEEFPWRAAALRELAEEARIVLTDRPVSVEGLSGRSIYDAAIEAGALFDATGLRYVSNWVTPVGVPIRFDTRFFVVAVDEGVAAASDDHEVFDAVWVTPGTALDRGGDGTWQIEFPTQVHLELLAELGTVEAAIRHAESVTPRRMEPRLATGEDGTVHLLLPGDPDYAGAGRGN